jgi:hypothetical protein
MRSSFCRYPAIGSATRMLEGSVTFLYILVFILNEHGIEMDTKLDWIPGITPSTLKNGAKNALTLVHTLSRIRIIGTTPKLTTYQRNFRSRLK